MAISVLLMFFAVIVDGAICDNDLNGAFVNLNHHHEPH
jgi:hypothetical protein